MAFFFLKKQTKPGKTRLECIRTAVTFRVITRRKHKRVFRGLGTSAPYLGVDYTHMFSWWKFIKLHTFDMCKVSYTLVISCRNCFCDDTWLSHKNKSVIVINLKLSSWSEIWAEEEEVNQQPGVCRIRSEQQFCWLGGQPKVSHASERPLTIHR